MASLYRLTVRMDGWPGAPGYMTFYALTATPFRSAVIAFVDDVRESMPSVISLTVPNQIDVLEDSTGELQGIETEGTEYQAFGTAVGTFAAPAGACVTWITNAFVNGRRVRGRTFLVPLQGAAFQADGTIASATLTALRDAAIDLFTACDLAVWHRPTTPSGSDGSAHEVTGSSVADRAAILTSRRS